MESNKEIRINETEFNSNACPPNPASEKYRAPLSLRGFIRLMIGILQNGFNYLVGDI